MQKGKIQMIIHFVKINNSYDWQRFICRCSWWILFCSRVQGHKNLTFNKRLSKKLAFSRIHTQINKYFFPEFLESVRTKQIGTTTTGASLFSVNTPYFYRVWACVTQVIKYFVVWAAVWKVNDKPIQSKSPTSSVVLMVSNLKIGRTWLAPGG